jgi:hypothetical protein
MGVVMTKGLVFVSFWELSDRYTYSLVDGLLLSFRSIYSDNGTMRFYPSEWSYFTCYALQRETGPPHVFVGDNHVALHIFSCPCLSRTCHDLVLIWCDVLYQHLFFLSLVCVYLHMVLVFIWFDLV